MNAITLNFKLFVLIAIHDGRGGGGGGGGGGEGSGVKWCTARLYGKMSVRSPQVSLDV